ncbi:hypothetical protein D7003_03010 [Arthrobacter oryzae]|uniref:Uncharacterized protein n=1 Tax=Arthrobacter oryzae TaxID=409290 RepID=A0A3N0C8E2_9MICC|nr:hypothetical protein D7003_03010 [Arthrobacter oryzae]
MEAAFNSVALAPLIICTKDTSQTLNTAGTWYDVKWTAETHSQGITHTNGDSTFVVSEAGIYQINSRVAFNGANVTGTIKVSINGIDKNETLEDEIGGVTAWPKPRINAWVKLAAGDAVKIRAYSNVNSTPLSAESNFFMSKVAGY